MREIDQKGLLHIRKARKDAIILDCRGADYWRWERIPDSANLRWKYVEQRASVIIPDRKTVVVTYCDGITCPASAKANRKLAELGYTELFEYAGGLSDWKAHGHATQSDRNHKLAPNVYLFPEQTVARIPVHCFLVEEADRIVLIDGPQQLTEEHEDFILNFGRPIWLLFTETKTAARAAELAERLGARCEPVGEGLSAYQKLFKRGDL